MVNSAEEVDVMELCTRSHDPLWDRIVYISVIMSKGLAKEINDKNTYKIVVLDEGTLTMESRGIKQMVSAPAIILLADDDVLFTPGKDLSATTVFFRPTEIRDEFTPERLSRGEFEEAYGKTIYQDYLLIKSFKRRENMPNRTLPLGLSAYDKISKTIGLMNNELTLQEDGFWPCRSRSYMMELLYFISYVCDISNVPVTEAESGEIRTNRDSRIRHSIVNDTVNDNTVSRIIQYLNEHMSEKVTLEDIMKEFSLNRNRLNELFIKETSMTCLNYLLKMRMNLAQIMLSETELRIAEIADRVGYADSNYFIKVFKSHTGVTPSKYRELYLIR
ncbi:MAG: helix-turn-helix transcriptional regulator [Lachnospiraceae bacterium]|nr:helix-turn-helix transcriptional regulator [Lachnospiraceae bacterium]